MLWALGVILCLSIVLYIQGWGQIPIGTQEDLFNDLIKQKEEAAEGGDKCAVEAAAGPEANQYYCNGTYNVSEMQEMITRLNEGLQDLGIADSIHFKD